MLYQAVEGCFHVSKVFRLSNPRSETASVSLQQDVSKGWLVLRFGSATAGLEARCGFIGARHLPTTEENVHALALRDATVAILEDFASPKYDMPLSEHKRTKYSKIMQKLVPQIEMLCADGASDEQLALDLMFKVFPSLKIATRDLCHSVRRVASRTTVADPYSKRVPLVLNPEMLVLGLWLPSKTIKAHTWEYQPACKVGALHPKQAVAVPVDPEQCFVQGAATRLSLRVDGLWSFPVP